MEICSSCGNAKPEFSEGVCVDCCQTAQIELSEHYRQYERWSRLTDKQREEAINRE